MAPGCGALYGLTRRPDVQGRVHHSGRAVLGGGGHVENRSLFIVKPNPRTETLRGMCGRKVRARAAAGAATALLARSQRAALLWAPRNPGGHLFGRRGTMGAGRLCPFCSLKLWQAGHALPVLIITSSCGQIGGWVRHWQRWWREGPAAGRSGRAAPRMTAPAARAGRPTCRCCGACAARRRAGARTPPTRGPRRGRAPHRRTATPCSCASAAAPRPRPAARGARAASDRVRVGS